MLPYYYTAFGRKSKRNGARRRGKSWPPLKEEDLLLPNDAKLVEDYKGNQLLLFASQWSIQWVIERNKGLKLAEFGGARF